jgi:hypothetical protein
VSLCREGEYWDGVTCKGVAPGTEKESDVALLWKPGENRGNVASLALWNDGHKIQFSDLPYPGWAIPDDPTWDENPFSDTSWQFEYQAMFWNWVPVYGYETSGDPAYLADLKRYILDWISDNPTADLSKMQWCDHSIAYRSVIWTYIYFKYFRGSLTQAEASSLVSSLKLHGQKLQDLLQTISNNHSFYHALALYNLARAYPDWEKSSEWLSFAKCRIFQVSAAIVDAEEGVTREQAMSYHWNAMWLMVTADSLFKPYGDELTPGDHKVLDKMLDFWTLMLLPGGYASPIGDSNNSELSLSSAKQYFSMGYGTSLAAYYLGSFVPPPPDSLLFARTGYASYRPNKPGSFQLVFDFGQSRWSHGHNDALNFLLQYNNERLITEAGGPYNYDSEHLYFVHARSHNTIVVDGQDYPYGDATLLAHADGPDYYFVQARHKNCADVTHTRSILVLKPDTVVVLDDLVSAENLSHAYDLLYHLPPGATATVAGDDLNVSVSSTTRAVFTVLASFPVTYQKIEGQTSPAWQGWITPSAGVTIAAPVMQYTQTATSGWFGTVIQPFVNVAPAIAASIERVGNDWKLSVDNGINVWQIDMPGSETLPTVHVMR